MIALTISDITEPDAVCTRLSDLIRRRDETGFPNAVCIRNDSFDGERFSEMADMISKLWEGDILLETDEPGNISKVLIRLMDRKPIIVGANCQNLEQFCIAAGMFGCPVSVSAERTEDVLDLVQKAMGLGISDILIDPMVRNMKQCLEVCTDLHRLSDMIPEAKHPVIIRAWSGEYAMSIASVALLNRASIVLVDDLDYDCCDTLNRLVSSAL